MCEIKIVTLSIEPVGAKAPTLSSDVKWSGIERKLNISIALLCPAQAFPVPAFRFVFFSIKNSLVFIKKCKHIETHICYYQSSVMVH